MTPGSRRRYLRRVGVAVGGLGLAGCLDGASDPGGSTASTAPPQSTEPPTEEPRSASTARSTPIHAGYETVDVGVESADGAPLGSVIAAVADTPALRYLGLSDTAELPADRGMLFVYDAVDDRTFVMRGMSFGIDIVYADGDGVITEIHHAPAPAPGENGAEHQYPGRGQYVLEVAYEWTTDRDVGVGDVLVL